MATTKPFQAIRDDYLVFRMAWARRGQHGVILPLTFLLLRLALLTSPLQWYRFIPMRSPGVRDWGRPFIERLDQGMATPAHLSDYFGLAPIVLLFVLGWQNAHVPPCVGVICCALILISTLAESLNPALISSWRSAVRGDKAPEYRWSDARSVLRVLVAFATTILGFGVLNLFAFRDDYNEPLRMGSALYHSAMTALTIGYGDIHPVKSGARASAVVQSSVSLLYVVLAIGRFSGQISNKRDFTHTTNQ